MSQLFRGLWLAGVCLVGLGSFSADVLAQREYGFDNRKGSGQPYLPPQETVARFQVPAEFEVKLFAAEPLVTNPIAFTVDEKGRIWVIECFEYPKRTPKGRAPRDRIVILEDTDGDGVADKRTVFAEGKDFPVPEARRRAGLGAFDLASGIEVGYGGVFVGAPPYLWFIENRGDKPGRFEVLLEGFGSQDTHETLNTFQWGPDGWLYGLHGIFTQSEVRPAQAAANTPPVRLNAAVWRYHPRSKRFEIFAEGTSNPWGMDWRNSDGQFILCCCVIPHLYHIVPGGIYQRQAGASYHPYVYGYLREICDHTFHKESGWAHAGLISLDVPHFPPRFQNSVIFGSIHGCSIKQNILESRGSTYLARRGEDFLRSGDKNFRPINLKWGPWGDIYVIDWHDQHPCHQTHPDDWDYDHGRIYRIQLRGTAGRRADDLGRLDGTALLREALSDHPYRWRTALRLLYELPAERKPAWAEAERLDLFRRHPLRRVWIAQALTRSAAQEPAEFAPDHPSSQNAPPEVLAWQVRFLAESSKISDKVMAKVASWAAKQPSATVRRELASAALRWADQSDVTPLLRALLAHKEDARDPVIPQLLWLTYEKLLSQQMRRDATSTTPSNQQDSSPASNDSSQRRPEAAPAGVGDFSGEGRQAAPAVEPSVPPGEKEVEKELAWLAQQSPGNDLIREQMVPRVMRRLAASGRREHLQCCLDFVQQVADRTTREKALEGLMAALDKQVVPPPANWPAVREELLRSQHPPFLTAVQRLSVSFRDPRAVQQALQTLQEEGQAVPARIEAIRQLALLQPAEGVPVLLRLAVQGGQEMVAVEAVRALAAYSGPEVAHGLLRSWPRQTPGVRAETLQTLASRKEWARMLLQHVAQGTIERTALTDNVILRLQAFQDKELDALIEKHWGRTRPTPAELAQLIERTRTALEQAPASFLRGRKVFENQCAKCHKFEGQGAEVGPALDGAGRDIDYILVNVLDPNRVIGAPYFVRTVVTHDDIVFQGILAEEDDQSITLKLEGGAFKTIRKANIAEVRIAEKSLMPEGLSNNMSLQEFRDLIRYLMAHPFITEGRVNGETVAVGVSGRFVLRPGSEGKGKAILEATFTATAALETRLLIGSAAPYEIFLDGQRIGRGTGAAGRVRPDMDAIPVRLSAGKHTVTVRLESVAPQGSPLYLRFLDPDRKLRYPDMLPNRP
ncbi:MAG: PVC-type heme-binding CxxCH protein [Thermogemmata sp.]